MPKQSKIAKEAKRRRIVARYAALRVDLKRRSVDPHLPADEREAAMAALRRLPRDASPVRLRNRDAVDGRPRAFIRQFGLSRIRLREMAHRGELPGVVKSSW